MEHFRKSLSKEEKIEVSSQAKPWQLMRSPRWRTPTWLNGTEARTPWELHSYLWEDGVSTNIGSLGGIVTEAYGMNERAQIVEQSTTAAGLMHPLEMKLSGVAK